VTSLSQEACTDFPTQLNHRQNLSRGVSYIITWRVKIQRKVIHQYNNFRIKSDSVDAVDSAEGNFSTMLQVDLHFSSRVSLQIYINCSEVWFYQKNGSHKQFFVTSFSEVIMLLCSRMHETYWFHHTVTRLGWKVWWLFWIFKFQKVVYSKR